MKQLHYNYSNGIKPNLRYSIVFACLVTILVGYVLTVIGFACLTVPWTTPPIVFVS